jgi:hypothetical protein
MITAMFNGGEVWKVFQEDSVKTNDYISRKQIKNIKKTVVSLIRSPIPQWKNGLIRGVTYV